MVLTIKDRLFYTKFIGLWAPAKVVRLLHTWSMIKVVCGS